jgi:non-specific serine/threonine protein kinase
LSTELKRFAPTLRTLILHSSECTIDPERAPNLSTIDLVITTYGMTQRLTYLQNFTWDTVIIDEAQAIKNPGTKQTKAVKSLQATLKFILTGTPIENSLLDLWSL